MTDSKRHNNPWDIINPEPLDEHALAGLKAQPVHPADRAVEAIGALRSTLKSGEAYSGHLEKLAQRGIEAIRDLEEQLEALERKVNVGEYAYAGLRSRMEAENAKLEQQLGAAVQQIRVQHASLAAVGGGPCICEWCASTPASNQEKSES